jgi:hypothetical protein
LKVYFEGHSKVALLYHLGINGFLCRKDGGNLSDLIVSDIRSAKERARVVRVALRAHVQWRNGTELGGVGAEPVRLLKVGREWLLCAADFTASAVF